MQETSQMSLKELKPILGERQKQVIKALIYLGEANNREIAEYLHLPINSVTPRVMELRSFGRVESVRTKEDQITKRQTLLWRLV